MPDSYIDAVESAVASFVADMRREMAAEAAAMRQEHAARLADLDNAVALFRARTAEAEARYALFERDADHRIAERLASVKDGEAGPAGADGRDGEPGRDGVDGRNGADGKDGEPGRDGIDGAAGKDGEPGRDGTDGKDAAPVDMDVVSELIGRAIEARAAGAIAGIERQVEDRLATVRDGLDGKDGIDGKDGAPGRDGIDGVDADDDAIMARLMEAASVRIDGLEAVIRSAANEARATVDARLAEVRDGRDGVDGKDGVMPLAKAWTDAVHYAGAIVTHAGATWQATQDTGQEPPHADWICLATAGADARGFVHAGTFSDDGEYRANDVVMLNGSTFLALRDAPGPCPGDGWQLWASRGSKGPIGERGPKGDAGSPGRDAAEVVGFYRDGDAVTMTFADGREMRA